MAMKFKTLTGDVAPDMNTTPLIDVMLVLLVMLIVTLPIQTHAVKINLPTNLRFSDPPPPVMTVNIDFDGQISWNGVPVDRATLDRDLAQIGEAASSDQAEVHITAHRLARYDTVAKVLSDAQRLGVVHIAIVGTQSYVNG